MFLPVQLLFPINESHTLRSICVCTLSTVITYVVKFIIVSGMACHSGRWGLCRCSPQSVLVNVSVCIGNIWDIADWMRIYSHTETQRTPSEVLFGPTRSLSRQLSAWPVAPDSNGTVTLDPTQGRQSHLPGFT